MIPLMDDKGSLYSERENNDPGSYRKLPNIIQAAYAGNHNLVAALLREGDNVNSVDPRDNLSILHIAGLQGDRELVRVVLDYERQVGGVDFTIRSLYRPRLAWQFAMNRNFIEIAELIDDAGLAKLNRQSPPRP